MRKLKLQKAIPKDWDSLPPKQYRQIVSAVLDLLGEPHPHYAKPLQGSLYWRIAVGENRVIYRADDDAVYVVAFGSRNDDAVYRALARKQLPPRTATRHEVPTAAPPIQVGMSVADCHRSFE